MGIERITKKILDEAEARKQEIAHQYEPKIFALKKQTEIEIKAIEQNFAQRQEMETQSILERAITEAYLEQKKQLLAEKWKIINEIFDTAAQKFVLLPCYPQILKYLIELRNEKNSEIIIAQNDALKLRELFPNHKFTETSTIKGGVIIKSAKIEKNFSLDATLKLLQDELIIELAKILFEV